jgi:hypothetical protein
MRQMEEAQHSQRVVDDRLDPYSSRYFPSESRTEELARVIREEKVIERIVRERTWAVIKDRCQGAYSNTWEEELKRRSISPDA